MGETKFLDLGTQDVNADILRINVEQLPSGYTLFFNVHNPDTKDSLGCGQFR